MSSKCLCSFFLVFLLLMLIFILNWNGVIFLDFSFLPLFFGFVVNMDERIRRKKERLAKVVKEFDEKLETMYRNEAWMCPQCFGVEFTIVEEDKPEEGVLGRLICKTCGHSVRKESLPISTEFPARVVNQVVRLASKGLEVEDIRDEVIKTAWDYGFNFNITRDSIYRILEEYRKSVLWTDRFYIVGVLEGIYWSTIGLIIMDEIFQRRIHRKLLNEYFESEHDKKISNFRYIITGIEVNTNYPFPPEPAEARNKGAFLSFALKIAPYIRDHSKVKFRSDDLKSATSALRLIYPESEIEVINRSEKRGKDLGKLSHIERLNRAYRDPLPKRRKFGSVKILDQRVTAKRSFIAYIEQYGGYKVVERLGLPWPKNIKRPSDLILFTKFLYSRAREILGDEYEIFENPAVGRLVLTLEVDALEENSLYLFKGLKAIADAGKCNLVYCGSWINYHEINKCIDYLVQEHHSPLQFSPSIITYVDPRARIIRNGNRIYIVSDMFAGDYLVLLLVPFFIRSIPAGSTKKTYMLICFNNIKVNPGRVNQYGFKLNKDSVITKNALLTYLKEPLVQFSLFLPKEVEYKNFTTDRLLRYIHRYIKRYIMKYIEKIWLPSRADLRYENEAPVEVNDLEAPPWIQAVSPYIELLRKVGEAFGALHLVHLTFGLAKEAMNNAATNTFDFIDFKPEILLAAFYVILNLLLGISEKDYFNELEKILSKTNKMTGKEAIKKEINIEEVAKWIERIPVRNIEALERRLAPPKSVLDPLIKEHGKLISDPDVGLLLFLRACFGPF